MDSGVFGQVFSSWEVIVTSLILMFLLPLVFFVASTRVGKKKPLRPASPRSRPKPPARTPRKAEGPEAGGEPRERRPSRAIEPPEDGEDKA